MPTPMRIAAVLVAALALAGCGTDDTDGTDATGTSNGRAGSGDEQQSTQLEQSCSNEEDGFRIRYPAGWHADERCEWFHPEQFELPRAQDAPGIAIHVREEPVSLERATSDGPTTEVLSRTRETVAGREAVRMEVRVTGGGLMPAGTRAVHWTIGLGGNRSIRASTYSVGDHDYEESRRVLDSMVDALELDER